MQSIFIAVGPGIPAGVEIPSFRNIDIAPTIAALLHIDMGRCRASR